MLGLFVLCKILAGKQRPSVEKQDVRDPGDAAEGGTSGRLLPGAQPLRGGVVTLPGSASAPPGISSVGTA